MICVRVIESFEEFLKLKDAWNELVVHSEVDHAFMKHEWFDQWIRAYEAQSSLHLVTAWRDGQLAAVLPLRRRDFSFRGVSARGFAFLSSDFTPRCNFICVDCDLIRSTLERVFTAENWDVIYFSNMEEGCSATSNFLEALDGDGKKFETQIVDGLHSPYLMTEGTWDQYWKTLSTKTRRQLERMCLRRLSNASSSELVRIETLKQFDDFKTDMFDISAKSWKADSNEHLIADTPQGRFYLNYTPIALEHGWVTLYAISVEGIPIGFEYLLTCDNRYSMIRCDFDRDYKYYTPGNGLRTLILQDLFSRDEICEYDMGGDAYSYKLKWTTQIRKHISVFIGNNTPRGKIIMTAKNRLLPRLRRIRHAVHLG